MNLSADKCHILTISKKKQPTIVSYTLRGQALQIHLGGAKYLGVDLTKDLHWNIQASSVKANKISSFVYRLPHQGSHQLLQRPGPTHDWVHSQSGIPISKCCQSWEDPVESCQMCRAGLQPNHKCLWTFNNSKTAAKAMMMYKIISDLERHLEIQHQAMKRMTRKIKSLSQLDRHLLALLPFCHPNLKCHSFCCLLLQLPWYIQMLCLGLDEPSHPITTPSPQPPAVLENSAQTDGLTIVKQRRSRRSILFDDDCFIE